MPEDRGRAELKLGVLAFAVWAVHAAEIVVRGEPWDLLWMCNLGGLLLAVGCAVAAPRMVAVAAAWMALGVPLWALDLLYGAEIRATSVISHVGGLALAVYAVRRLGWPRWTMLPATGALAALVLISRLVTPRAANVNLAFAVWSGWEGWFVGHAAYLALLAALATAAFAGLEALGRRFG